MFKTNDFVQPEAFNSNWQFAFNPRSPPKISETCSDSVVKAHGSCFTRITASLAPLKQTGQNDSLSD